LVLVIPGHEVRYRLGQVGLGLDAELLTVVIRVCKEEGPCGEREAFFYLGSN
jgi:hypothetical protein